MPDSRVVRVAKILIGFEATIEPLARTRRGRRLSDWAFPDNVGEPTHSMWRLSIRFA